MKVESARKVCREMGGRENNPWVVGHDVEVEEMRREISGVATERNTKVGRMKAMERLRKRWKQEMIKFVRQEIEEVRECLKEAFRRIRWFLRRLE